MKSKTPNYSESGFSSFWFRLLSDLSLYREHLQIDRNQSRLQLFSNLSFAEPVSIIRKPRYLYSRSMRLYS